VTVDRATRHYVKRRDVFGCLAALLDGSHRCVDQWGNSHAPTDPDRLTIEHVRRDPGGTRSDDASRLVVLCWSANVEQHWGSSTENRALLDAYLYGCTAGESMCR